MTVWTDTILGKVLTFQRGMDLPHSKMRPGPYPVMGSNGIIGWHDTYTTEAPSVTIGRSGSVGKPHLLKKVRSWSHNTCLFVKDFKGNDPYFIYYLVLSLDLGRFGGGSAVPTLNRNILHDLKVRVPDLQTQRKIAAVLSALDDKIENNRRICKTLEEMAQAIFKSWFVDFEPWGGVMPEGWRRGKLGDLVMISRNSVTPGDMPETVEHYSLPAFDETHLPSYDMSSTIKSNKFRVGKNAILYSKLNPSIKRLWDPFVDTETAVSSTEFVVIEPRLVVQRYFIYSILDARSFHEYACSHSAGTTNSHQRISPEDILGFDLWIPNDEIIKKYSELVEPMFATVKVALKEISKLALMRDALLPKLMSGEIDVDKVVV